MKLDNLMDILTADRNLKTVEYIRDPKFTIKVTRRFKPVKYPRSKDYHEDLVMNIGRPGYRTRAWILKNPSESVRKVMWPKKRK